MSTEENNVIDPTLIVTTDQADYAPGTTATFTVSNVDVGGTVTFDVDHVVDAGADGIIGTADDTLANDLSGTAPWTITDGGEGDLDGVADGKIVTSWAVNDDASNQTFVLTATDTTTGETATAEFTDAPPPPPDPSGAEADLTAAGSSDTLSDGVYIEETSVNGTGSGAIEAFLRIQNSPSEEGYNTDGDTDPGGNQDFQFDQKAGAFTHSIQLADIPIVSKGGVLYREFFLDLGEAGGNSAYLSLDDLQIYSASSGSLVNLDPATGVFLDTGNDAEQLYNLDGWIALKDLEAGNGQYNYRILIPETYFDSTDASANIYLYAQLGAQGDGWDVDSTFEEFAIRETNPDVGILKAATVYDADDNPDSNNTIDSNTDYIKYTVTVTNTGSTALTGVEVTDSFEGGSSVNLGTPTSPGTGVTIDESGAGIHGDDILEVGEVWTYTYTHDVLPAEFTAALAGDLGGDSTFDNVATVDTDQTGPESDPASVGVESGPNESASLILEKDTVCVEDGGSINGGTLLVGSSVTWIYTLTDPEAGTHVSNIVLTDNQNGTDFVIYDSGGLHGGATLDIENDNGDDILDAGETWTFTLTGTVEAGSYTNTTNATGDDVDSGLPVTEADSETNSYTGVNVAEDSITVLKEVSVDGGLTWEDANDPTGPTLLEGYDDPLYRFTITNNSDVSLDIHLVDATLGIDETVTVAGGGGSELIDEIGGNPITAAWTEGQNLNTADVSATFTDDCENTASPIGSDDANYFGAAPSISIDKYIVCADGESGPFGKGDNDTIPNLLSGDVNYVIEVSNAGNVAISNIVVTDPTLGGLLTLAGDENHDGIHDDSEDWTVGGDANNDGILDLDETWTYTVVGEWAAGEHTNTAGATGTFTDDAGNVADASTTDDLDVSDSVTYFGANPSIDVEKLVSVDGGAHWFDADDPTGPVATDPLISPIFKFVVHNTGNVDLTDIVLSDSDFDLSSLANGGTIIDNLDGSITIASLAADDGAAGGDDEIVLSITESWGSGQHTDTATVSATFTDDCGDPKDVGDTDAANYFGFDIGVHGLTQGFWGQHQEAWDGKIGTNKKGDIDTANLFNSGVLTKYDVLPDSLDCSPTQDWNGDGKTDKNDSGILLGDANGNGVVDTAEAFNDANSNGKYDLGETFTDSNGDGLYTTAENTLWVSLDAARQIIMSSDSANDTRQILMKQALAAQLNIYNGDKDPLDLVGEAVAWLKGQGPYTYPGNSTGKVDTNQDGILSGTEYSTSSKSFTSDANFLLVGNQVLTSNLQAWQKDVDVWDPTGSVPAGFDGTASGEDLKNALMYFNQDQLITSADGLYVGWNAGGTVDPATIHENTIDNFWLTLSQEGKVA